MVEAHLVTSINTYKAVAEANKRFETHKDMVSAEKSLITLFRIVTPLYLRRRDYFMHNSFRIFSDN